MITQVNILESDLSLLGPGGGRSSFSVTAPRAFTLQTLTEAKTEHPVIIHNHHFANAFAENVIFLWLQKIKKKNNINKKTPKQTLIWHQEKKPWHELQRKTCFSRFLIVLLIKRQRYPSGHDNCLLFRLLYWVGGITHASVMATH